MQTCLSISRAWVPLTESQESAKTIENGANCRWLCGVILDLNQEGRLFFNLRDGRGIAREL